MLSVIKLGFIIDVMKRVFVLITFAALLYIYMLSNKAREYAEFQRWVACLEQSDYSDTACYECDEKFNKEGKFDLSSHE